MNRDYLTYLCDSEFTPTFMLSFAQITIIYLVIIPMIILLCLNSLQRFSIYVNYTMNLKHKKLIQKSSIFLSKFLGIFLLLFIGSFPWVWSSYHADSKEKASFEFIYNYAKNYNNQQLEDLENMILSSKKPKCKIAGYEAGFISEKYLISFSKETENSEIDMYLSEKYSSGQGGIFKDKEKAKEYLISALHKGNSEAKFIYMKNILSEGYSDAKVEQFINTLSESGSDPKNEIKCKLIGIAYENKDKVFADYLAKQYNCYNEYNKNN